ncbi:N-acyl-D-amino-acid deacylase family protein [Parahaliea mediterranea]|uniref:Amidohydrolase family protein n=1 Tax=Parahaliea mediterranea TaxID=651086 RepID=A0A939IJ50_9GAMM|nr:amidohydrolase family protein [Parahaliea mediterranea]MBN7795901.1 amidohydrolase family protein [Parahaliea mediterranea]
MYDLIIKNARIFDGTGEPPFHGAVAVSEGRIAAMGTRLDGDARAVVDAGGRALAPGFIDSHTHFDAQITWDGLATPSLEHGVTTVINGNCSLTMAPVRARHREFVGAVFRQIEEMPAAAFDAGMRWNWETFEEYLASFRDQLGINVATLAGHSMLRLWVMGEAARERCATDDEIARMQQLLRECLDAGALGLSTSWVDIDHEHRPVPCRLAAPEELDALCAVLGEYGAVMQVVPEFWDPDLLCVRIDILGELSRRHGITVSFSPLFDSNATPDLVQRALARVRLQTLHGARVVPQMQTRPIDVTFEFDMPTSVFSTRPTWWATILKPHAETLRDFQDAGVRKQLVEEAYNGLHPIAMEVHFPDFIVNRCHLAHNKPLEGRCLRDIAAERDCDPVELMLDLAVEEDLKTCFTALEVGHNNLERITGPIADPLVQIGSGDGGAHVTRFATYGDTGYLFSRFVRDAGALTPEQAVYKLTGQVAANWGLVDRGRLRPGLAADLVLFDLDTIDRGPEIAVEDLPAEGYRYVRRARGVEQVYVNGVLAYSAGDGYSGDRGGRIVSSPRVAA